MSISCPACGGAVDLTERALPVLTGACPNCAREVFLLAPGGPVPKAPEGSTAAEADETGAPRAEGLAIPHPGDDCEGTILLAAGGPDRLVGVCDDCGEEFAFVLSTGAESDEEGAEEDEEEDRPTRRPAPRFGNARPRERPAGRFGDDRPVRPCRQCGGPLTFETGEDGTVTGRCTACGNTFTLPRRRENRGFDRGGGGRDRRPSYGRGAPRRYGGGGGGRDYRGRSDDRRPGRRPRRDD